MFLVLWNWSLILKAFVGPTPPTFMLDMKGCAPDSGWGKFSIGLKAEVLSYFSFMSRPLLS